MQDIAGAEKMRLLRATSVGFLEWQKSGAPTKTYIKLLQEDTNMTKHDLLTLMCNRGMWRTTLMACEAASTKVK